MLPGKKANAALETSGCVLPTEKAMIPRTRTPASPFLAECSCWRLCPPNGYLEDKPRLEQAQKKASGTGSGAVTRGQTRFLCWLVLGEEIHRQS